MPSIYFMFNRLWVELKAVDYMIDVSGDWSLCQLMLFKNPLGFNIFGAPLFHGYYTIHDPVEGTIGFVPTIASPKKPLVIGEVPIHLFVAPISFATSFWVYFFTSLIVVVLAFIYHTILLPTLKSYITNQLIVVTIATISVEGVIAAYVFLLLPLIKKAFAEQTELMYVSLNNMPFVQSSGISDTIALITAAGLFALVTSYLAVRVS